MSADIVVKGIETNNLKNIDISLKKNAINLILGPSGSGKSSLAYDTVAQIGLHELGAMYYDGINEPEYKVSSYDGMVVTVPVKQLNNNNNVRSTIGTYFSLNPCLAKIFASLLDMPYDYFVLNKAENVCDKCQGVGYTKELDQNKIIDFDKKVSDVPIRCWNKNKDFYKQILELYCNDEGIPTGKTFRQLTKQQCNKILSGTSSVKYKIKYKSAGCTSTRTTPYYGPLTDTPMLKRFSPSSDFYSEIKCDKCDGEKFEIGHRDKKVAGYSIGEVLVLPMHNVEVWIKDIRKKYDCTAIEFSLKQLETFVEKAIELNLGHLFFNRTIPSLSGGELQRLRLIQIFASQLSDLLIILDEPLAGLSGEEKQTVYQNIKQLVKKHTLLIVDHHDLFISDAKNIIVLGEGGGDNGGSIIDKSNYLKIQKKTYSIDLDTNVALKNIKISAEIYGFNGAEVQMAMGNMNVVSGPSGVGKSTLLREYFNRYFDKYIYISQKPLNGNSHSTIASALDINTKITQEFAKKFDKDKSFFSNMPSADGACPVCGGTGKIVYGSDSQSQITLKCKECRGTGFRKELMKFKFREKSIQDVYEMTIDEASIFFESNKDIYEQLHRAQEILLGHLKVGEKTSDLSGGENIRVKIIRALDESKEVYGIDEPFKGLNQIEMFKVASMLKRLSDMGKTIIVVDHEESSFKYFAHHVLLKNKKGILVGD